MIPVLALLTVGTGTVGRAADPIIFTQIPVQAETGEPSFVQGGFPVANGLPVGSRIVAFDPAKPNDGVTVLTSDFASAGRPDVSFDGQRILFVGRRGASGRFDVWEMNAEGGEPRRITDGSADVSKAIHLSTIYTIDAKEPVYQIAYCSDAGGAPGGALHTCRMDGTRVRRITFDPYGASDPRLLSDGRLLLSRWSQPSESVTRTHGTMAATDLMTVHTDGADLFAFAAVHEPPAVRSMPTETPDGWVVYVESPVGQTDGGGSLVAVARTRSLHTKRVVADDPNGLYHSPFAMADGNLLVSYRTKAGGSYGIRVLDQKTGSRVSDVYDDPQWHEVDAVVVGPRSIPRGRSSVVDERVDSGKLYCLDAYLSNTAEGRRIGRGQIKQVRVIRALASTSDRRSEVSFTEKQQAGPVQPTIREMLLGDVPVDTDGSFFLEVPARTPLRLETLDAAGNVLQAMQSWIWVMPKGRQGCIGCHEDRERTPPNRHVLALRGKPRTPTTSEPSRALQIAAQEGVPPEVRSSVAAALEFPFWSGTGRTEETQFPLYVGRGVCLTCHSPEGAANPCAMEAVPEHERAYEVLARPEAFEIAALSGIVEEPRDARICLECHAASADAGPRWRADSFSIEQGVQCESCHEAGSLHAQAHRSPSHGPISETAGMITPGDPQVCVLCHVDKPSHKEVLENGFVRRPADRRYKTPVNLATSPNGDWLYVVCEQGDSLIVVDTRARRVVDEITVGKRPQDIAVSPDGRRLYVTNRMGGTLTVIDAMARKVIGEVPVGAEPHGVLTDPDGRYVYVANTGQDSISIIDAHTLSETKRLTAGGGPWSLALSLDGRLIYATSVRPHLGRFRDPPRSEVTVLDVERGIVTGRPIADDTNMLQGIAPVAGRKVAVFTMMRTKSLLPITRITQGWTITNGLGVLWPDGRIDQVLLDEPNAYFPDPWDVAVSPDGRHALVTSGGADEVAVVDVAKLLGTITEATDNQRREVLPNHLGMSSRYVLKRIAVGSNPRGIVFSPDGRFAYVTNALDDSVSVITAADFTVIGDIKLGGPTEVSQIRLGAKLFHSADITFGRQFSCRSCHPDGHINGLPLDIEADGIGMHPVDNRTLRGILDTAPLKWEGTNPSLHRQCGARLAVFFTRLAPYTPGDLDALVRYMCTIERPPNPYRSREGLTLAQRRGKAVFDRRFANDGRLLTPQQRCLPCHRGAYKTCRLKTPITNTMWFDAPVDFDSFDLFDAEQFGELGVYYYIEVHGPKPLNMLDVPHLTDLYNSAPYLHNGAANTLEEVWTRFNVVDDHGMSDDLTRQQLNDLIAYLKSL